LIVVYINSSSLSHTRTIIRVQFSRRIVQNIITLIAYIYVLKKKSAKSVVAKKSEAIHYVAGGEQL